MIFSTGCCCQQLFSFNMPSELCWYMIIRIKLHFSAWLCKKILPHDHLLAKRCEMRCVNLWLILKPLYVMKYIYKLLTVLLFRCLLQLLNWYPICQEWYQMEHRILCSLHVWYSINFKSTGSDQFLNVSPSPSFISWGLCAFSKIGPALGLPLKLAKCRELLFLTGLEYNPAINRYYLIYLFRNAPGAFIHSSKFLSCSEAFF